MPTRWTAGLLALSPCGCSGPTAPEAAPPARLEFVDVAAAAGIDLTVVCGDPRRWYIPESNGSGAAWLDHDGDGDVDLFVGNGARMSYHDDGARLELVHDAPSRLYANLGGMRFADATAAAGIDCTAWVNAVTVADVEGDGDPDIYLACFGPDVFLRNEGGRFVDATDEAGLATEETALWGAGAAFGDADGDGDLDLYVANYCLFDPANPPAGGARQLIDGVEIGWGPEAENGAGYNAGAPDVYFAGDGRGRFRVATAQAGLVLEKALCSYAVVFSDVDLDGRQDILVANDLQPCNLFHNEGAGRFAEQGAERGFALNRSGAATAAMGLFVEDIDFDGDFDVYRTNFDLETNSLHVNDGRGYFVDQAEAFGLAGPSADRLGWGGGFFDADCDGDYDLLVANGHVLPQAEDVGMHPFLQRSQLFEAVPHERLKVAWREVADPGSGLEPLRSSRGVAFADADADGDLDALVVDLDRPPRLLENRSARAGEWIRVRLVGRGAARDALGARVRVLAGGRSWSREVRRTNGLYSSHEPTLHFGLGEVDGVDLVEVRWPGGGESLVERPPLGELLVIHEDREPR